MSKIFSLWSLISIYLVLSLTTYIAWHTTHKNPIIGDEPHYLVMANGIGKYHTLEQTLPYQKEFQEQAIFTNSTRTPDTAPSPKNTQAVQGPHGLYNVHNLGLPILLALPMLWAGIVGAKLCMILLNSFIIVLAWKISALFSFCKKTRFFAILVSCIGLPLIPAANQIFPDLLSGIIALSGLYWFMTLPKQRAFLTEITWMAVIAFLPWLQIKFTATCSILFFAIGLKSWTTSKSFYRPLLFFIVILTSCAALAFYNQYAFGKFSGPYPPGALQFNKTALMVFLGLNIDQNQGFFMQNLAAFIGLATIGGFYTRYKTITLLWGLVFLSLIAPNATHNVLYGGWSFSGRFAWSAAIVFMLMTIFGVTRIIEMHKKIFQTFLGILLAWQAYLFYRYTFQGVGLYKRPAATDFSQYSMYFGKAHAYLPAFYNVGWTYNYAPNYAWVIFLVLLFCTGFSSREKLKIHLLTTLSIGCLIIFIAGLVG